MGLRGLELQLELVGDEGDYEYALKLGTAAGGATAFSDGLAQKEKIAELLETL